jgi:hypothetical protein
MADERERVCARCGIWVYWDNADVTFHCGCNAGWKWAIPSTCYHGENRSSCKLCALAFIMAAGPQSSADREAQRRSFAYGNTSIENPRITRELIDREAEKLDAERRASSRQPGC